MKAKAKDNSDAPLGRRWAVIIGISRYRDTRLNLPYAARDAQALSQLLQTGGFNPDRTILLLDDQATTAAVARALRSSLKQPAPEDLVLIFFACHTAPDPDRPNNLYLLTHDTDPNDIAGSALPMSEVYRALTDTLLAKNIVVIADASHRVMPRSGSSARAINAYLSEAGMAKGVALLTSTDDEAVSASCEQWGGGHSTLAHFLLQGLRGEAHTRPKDDKITVGELFDYVFHQVSHGTSDRQRPFIASYAFDSQMTLSTTTLALQPRPGRVHFVRRPDLPPEVDQESALQKAEQVMATGESQLEVAVEDNPADYQIVVNASGEYEVWDAAGTPLLNLRPALRIAQPRAPAILNQRLARLAQYHVLLRLETPAASPLAGKLVAELMGKLKKYDYADPFKPEPFDAAEGPPTVEVGEWVGLRIKNDAAQTLNISVFDLQPDWAVSLIYPTDPSHNLAALDPGQELFLPLHVTLPSGYAEGIDVIKVFATTQTADLSMLELPSLDEVSAHDRRGAPTALESRLLALTSRISPSAASADPSADKEWATAQVTVRTKLTESEEEKIDRLNREVALLYQQGRYEQALSRANEAIDLARARLGDQSPALAAAIDNLAGVHFALGNHDIAERLWQELLILRRQTIGEHSLEYADALTKLASLQAMKGHFIEAKGLLEVAGRTQNELVGEDHPAYATSLNDLGRLARALGEYHVADPLLRQALLIRQRAFGPEHPLVAETLINLADLYAATERYDEAERLYKQALSIHEISASRVQFAGALSRLAKLYVARGRYEEAGITYQHVSQIQYQALGPDHPDVARTLSDQAELSVLTNQIEAARSYYQRALEIYENKLGTQHPNVVQLWGKLASFEANIGNYDSAEKYYRRALEFRQKGAGPAQAEVGRLWEGLARLYVGKKDFATAEAAYQDACEILAAALGENHLDHLHCLNRLVRIYLWRGKYEVAEAPARRSFTLTAAALGQSHPEYILAAVNIAKLHVATGRLTQPFKLLQQVNQNFGRVIENLLVSDSEHLKRGCLRSLEECVNLFLSLVTQHLPPSPDYYAAAFECVARSKRMPAEAWAASRYTALTMKYPAHKERLEELFMLRSQIADRLMTGPDGMDAAGHQQLLQAWQERRDELDGQLADQISELKLERRLLTLDRREIANALPPNSVLIEFVCFPVYNFLAVPERGEEVWQRQRYLAFVVPAGSPDEIQMRDLGEAEQIDGQLRQFLESITARAPVSGGMHIAAAPPPEISPGDPGLRLRAAVFDPVAALVGERSHIILAPDGQLVHLPFAALPTDDHRFLIELYQFVYLQVGRDVLRANLWAATTTGSPLVIADPNFDLMSSTAPGQRVDTNQRSDEAQLFFGRLPGTQTEASAVAELLDVQPWLGERALEGSLKAYAAPRILHVASHSFFLPDETAQKKNYNPLLRAGIALAGANQVGVDMSADANDGILTAAEISALNLSGTELVVLSACGDSSSIQSFTGLQRAFYLAGAQRLVMNLWTAPDQKTTQLMTDFYKRMLSGEAPATALRHAQLALKNQAQSLPHEWGAFVCLSDLTPLTVERPFTKAPQSYVVGLPARGEQFVGREDILRLLQENLAPGAVKNILVLRGQRRTGKTSVIYRLCELLPKDEQNIYVPVLIDLQGLPKVKDESDFFYGLAMHIWEGLSLRGIEVAEPDLDAIARNPRIAFEIKFLNNVTNALGAERQLLLLIDEFDQMKYFIDEGLPHSILDYLRHLMQHRPVLFLLAGTHRLREFTGGYWSVFFNLSVPVDIGTMSEKDARTLIVTPVQRYYTIQPEAVDEIVRVAGCHPYFTQLVCRELLEIRNRYRVNVVGVSHVSEAVGEALKSGAEQIGFPWTEKDCGPEERLVMAALAAATSTPTVREIEQSLQLAGLTIDAGAAVKSLRDRGVARRNEKGQFSFVVPLFQRWLMSKGYHDLPRAAQYNIDPQSVA